MISTEMPCCFEAFCGLIRTFNQCTEGDDRDVRAFANLLGLAERDQEVARRILRFVIDLAVKMLVFEEQDRVVAADRGP